MSEWREEEARPRYWGNLRKNALIGAACACVVIGWMMFARPGEDVQSTRGFNMGAEGESRGASRVFSTHDVKTSLDMVSSAVGSGPPGVLTSASPAAPALPVAAQAAAAPPAAAAEADETKELAKAGISTDAKGLARLGAEDGALSALAAKLLDHPNVLKAIFNNKLVVDALMGREGAKELCQNGGALKSYLSDPKSGGMTGVFPVIQAGLSEPGRASALVSALAGTEMVKRVTGCPSLTAISQDSSAIISIAAANPKALGLVMDTRGMAALASDPRALGALTGVQSKLGGAP
jgi:hypothetical protein